MLAGGWWSGCGRETGCVEAPADFGVDGAECLAQWWRGRGLVGHERAQDAVVDLGVEDGSPGRLTRLVPASRLDLWGADRALGGGMAEPVRARRLTDQEGQRLQQIARRGKHGSVRVRRAGDHHGVGLRDAGERDRPAGGRR